MTTERFDFLLQQYLSEKYTLAEWKELKQALSDGKLFDRMERSFDALMKKDIPAPVWPPDKKKNIWAWLLKRTR